LAPVERWVSAIRDPELREVTLAESKSEFCKVWKRWRRRSVALYPESLRDQLFFEGERLAAGYIRERRLGTNSAPEQPPRVVEQLPPALESVEPSEPADELPPTLLQVGAREAEQHPPSSLPKPLDILEQLPPPLPPASFKPIGVEERLPPPPPSSPPAPALQGVAERNLAAALALAAAGIPVFPVRIVWSSRKGKWDKPPAIHGWQQESTVDLERIRVWWRDLAAALGIPAHHLVPGVWCGHPDLRLVVIDADRHGGPDGVAAFDALVEENWLPFGPVTKTPTDGRHHFFRALPGETFGGALPDGIDVRGNGFVVGPGSVRPDGAVWEGCPSLTMIRPDIVPELPDWIAALIRTPKPVPKEVRKEKPRPDAELSPAVASSSSNKTKLPAGTRLLSPSLVVSGRSIEPYREHAGPSQKPRLGERGERDLRLAPAQKLHDQAAGAGRAGEADVAVAEGIDDVTRGAHSRCRGGRRAYQDRAMSRSIRPPPRSGLGRGRFLFARRSLGLSCSTRRSAGRWRNLDIGPAFGIGRRSAISAVEGAAVKE
jgi:hypothetical protein